MEIDQFIAENQPVWRRLEDVSRRTSSRAKRVGPNEIDELLGLYDVVSVHLSQARARYDDTVLTDGLSRSLGEARAAIYGSRAGSGRPIRTFFSVALPAAMFQTRRAILLAALVTLVPAVIVGVWLAHSPDVRNAEIPAELQKVIANDEFEHYYSSKPAQQWVFELFTHNIEVAVMAFGLGAAGAVGAIALLGKQGQSVGTMAAVLHSAGRGELFWGLILPHGLLELSAVFMSGGAGLAIAWAVIVPGDRSRSESLRLAGMRSSVVMLGAMCCLVCSAIIEAFVTPSELPIAVRVGIGVVTFTALLTYGLGLGSRVTRNGATGTFADLDGWAVEGDDRPVSASRGRRVATASPAT